MKLYESTSCHAKVPHSLQLKVLIDWLVNLFKKFMSTDMHYLHLQNTFNSVDILRSRLNSLFEEKHDGRSDYLIKEMPGES